MMDNKDYNRIKVALVEQKKTARWLSDALGKDPATISKWCTNTTQPSLEMLFKISELLQVPIQDLVRKQNFEYDRFGYFSRLLITNIKIDSIAQTTVC